MKVKIDFHLDSFPKRFKVSPQLVNVLGIEEDSRMRIVGALWQYIKSNRLQDKECREIINCNKELVEAFGKEKLDVFKVVEELSKHLSEADPITIEFDVKRGEELMRCFELPVLVHPKINKQYVEFLTDCNVEWQ